MPQALLATASVAGLLPANEQQTAMTSSLWGASLDWLHRYAMNKTSDVGFLIAVCKYISHVYSPTMAGLTERFPVLWALLMECGARTLTGQSPASAWWGLHPQQGVLSDC